MKKTKKIVISIIIILLIIILSVFSYFKFFYDSSRLSIKEKEWITNNLNKVISIGVPANINNFSKDGNGVFYDFLDDFKKKNGLNINKNTYTSYDNSLGFVVSNSVGNNDLIFYKDNYVILSKNYEVISSVSSLNGKSIGLLNDDSSYLSSYEGFNGTLKLYTDSDSLFSEFNEDKVTYVMVPLNEYVNLIIEKNYNVVYQFEDIVKYYYLKLGSDNTLNSILVKYYNEWSKDKLEDSYYSNYFNLFKDSLNLTDIEVQGLTNKVYNVGFVNKTPYISMNGKKVGGVISEYLKDFSKLTNVEFNYIKYKNNNDLNKAYSNNKLDIIFNDSENRDNIIKTNINEMFYIISNNNDIKFYSSLNMINDKVCVLRDSNLSSYLKGYTNIDLELVKNENKLISCYKKNKLVAIDSESYKYYINNKINDSYVVYEGYNSVNFNFKYNNSDDAFSKIFMLYINFIGYREMCVLGVISYDIANSTSAIVGIIAKYVLIVFGIGILVIGLIISRKKRIKLNTKIRKDEKLKFVDMMTSLKNRNYLNERMEDWNLNTIYPQAIIVIDLNNVKYLNDTFGHEEGDKQIMAAANVLHQNQLDNTEIMRTDGNEFMVYMVGYNEKQVINYIKKLVKEFSNLPYDYGAAIGFSMIVDDLKLIDDAINEASLLMRENKEIEYNEIEKQD